MKYLGCKACCDEEVRGDDPADFLEEYEVKIRDNPELLEVWYG